MPNCYNCAAPLRSNVRPDAIYCEDRCRVKAFRARRKAAARVLDMATEALNRGDVSDWRDLTEVAMQTMRSTPGGADVNAALDAIGYDGPRGPFDPA